MAPIFSLRSALSLSCFCSSVSSTYSSTTASSSALPFFPLPPFAFLAASSASRRFFSSSSASNLYFSSSSLARRSSSSFLALASASSYSSSFLVFLPALFFLLGDCYTTGGFGSSFGISSFSNFFSKVVYSFLNPLISLLKNSSRSFNLEIISLKHSSWMESRRGAI